MKILGRWLPSRTGGQVLAAPLLSLLLFPGAARGGSRCPTETWSSLQQTSPRAAEHASLTPLADDGASEAHGVHVSAILQTQVNQREAGDSRGTTETPAASGSTPGTDPGKKNQPDPNTYIIGEQDSLAITVWKEKEISGGVVVRPDGIITVPLVGEVKVVGMTPVQLQSLLAEKLKPFVTVPQVTVAVTDIRSRKVYLVGHAIREGTFTINSSTTVLQLIVQAGGLTDFAKRKKIYILRQQGDRQVRFPFNYEDVIRGKHIEQNIVLQPGDTIVVP